MNKYILLRAEDAEKIKTAFRMSTALEVLLHRELMPSNLPNGKDSWMRQMNAVNKAQIKALALIPEPIEISEEAREFVRDIRFNHPRQNNLNGFCGRTHLITDDEAAAMLAARDKVRLQGYIEKIKNEQVDAVNTGDASDEAYNQAL